MADSIEMMIEGEEGRRTPHPSMEDWRLAARPRTLWVGAVPVVVGSSVAAADGKFQLLSAIAALSSAILIQIGTNFANDLFDYKKGVDNHERIGPPRALQAGRVTEQQMRQAIFFVFVLASLFGSYLVYFAGWPILVIGILSLLFGIAYTGGPFPLGYHGLGDLMVFVFFGLVAVSGTYYVHAVHFSESAFGLSLSIGFLATAVLAVNNIRDIESDRRARKNTLAVKLGLKWSRRYYMLLLMSAWISLFLFYLLYDGNYWLLLPFVLVPMGISLARIVFDRRDGPSLIRALSGTVKLEMWFGLLLVVGVLMGEFF